MPWGPVDAQGIYDALDGVNRSVRIPSGPWSADGSAAGAAARSGLGGAAGAGALGAAPTVHPVRRQSVRRSFGQPSGTQVRPGTPPPAVPPTPPAFRRPEPPAASSARGGATAVLGSMPASVPASAPPSLPPSVRLAAVRRLPDDFDDFISRSAESERKTINATPIATRTATMPSTIGVALMVFRSDSAERLMKSSKSSGSRRTAASRTLGGRDGGAEAGTDAGMEPSTAVAPPRAEDAAGGSGRRKAGGVGGTAGGGVPGRTWVPDGCPNDRRTDWRRTGWTVGAAPSAPAPAAPPRPERAAAPAAEPSALHGPDGIVTDRLTPSSAS